MAPLDCLGLEIDQEKCPDATEDAVTLAAGRGVDDQRRRGRRAIQTLFAFGDGEDGIASERRGVSAVTVARLRPPVKAHGGKYYLARKIVPILLSVRGEVTEYLEPCAFGASVFLAMPRFEREILGDVNPGVVDLWSVLSDEKLSGKLRERLSGVPYRESVFDEAKQEGGGTIVDRAIRFLVRCRFSRGGLGKSFAWSERLRGGRPGDENAWATFRAKELPKIMERARGVEVTSDPCWWTVWESRRRVQRLIYADPPYMRHTRTAADAYGPYEMSLLHHFWLVAALRAHSGFAAISGYRCPEYDQWLSDWRRIDFEMPNNAAQGREKQRRVESLWLNW